MSLLNRYILRILVSSFLACLIGLTAVIWITQALRELDLLTAKGQTILIFLAVTAMSLPALITVIAPVALFIAVIYTLNKLNGDSELIVMSASGLPPGRLLRPFLFLTCFVSLLVGYLTISLIPESFRDLRDLVTKIRADVVTNIVKEGQFTSLESGVTFHYRDRGPGGALLGIFLQDRRDKNRINVYIAERGQAVEIEGKNYLVLEKGSIQRQQPGSRDSSVVAFERYAIDLSAISSEAEQTVYKPRERSTKDLIFPDTKDTYYQFQEGRFRAELHDRLSAPLYPFALMLLAFAALGEARTTRQGRGTAIAAAIIGVGALKIMGFAASSAAIRNPNAVVVMYVVPFAACLLSIIIVFQETRVREMCSAVANAVSPLFMPLVTPFLMLLRRVRS